MLKKLPILRPLSWASRRISSSASATSTSTSTSTSTAAISSEKNDDNVKNKEKESEKSGALLYRRLSALGGAPTGSVFKTMNKWVREGRPTKAMDLINHVKDLRKYRRYKHALELMDWMVKVKGMNLSYSNHAVRIDLLSKVKGIEAAEDYFSKLAEPAKVAQTYGALFNCYCGEKLLDKALSLYQKMKELNFASNNLLINNLMSLYMKLELPEKVPVLFQEMKASNLIPDTITCCIVMSSFASMNDIDSVERLMNEMEADKEVTIQWKAYSTLASVYISAGNLEKAELAIKKIEELIDSHEQEPFHYLLSLYANTGNLEEVYRVWTSYKVTHTNWTNMSYLAMLRALNKLDDIEGLKLLYEEWESTYKTFDCRLTNAVISGYLRKGMCKEAESLYSKSKEKKGNFDFRTSELFMDYYLKEKDSGSALKWLEVATQMVKGEEWALKSDKTSLFLQHLEEAKDVDGIMKLCKILKKLNCLGQGIYEVLLRMYSAADKKDPSLCELIEQVKVELDSKTQELPDEMRASKR